eukprot:TRINITY_DN12147_c0_g1_i4.p1 TRINITY_DN12147_c0_g1~~TRINITY_DN12147_c0_g1_i4.p1  ORF type:complete len:428 (+),score=58.34 TRINITY_DN12147_c0_g1_i4:209-1492(+)
MVRTPSLLLLVLCVLSAETAVINVRDYGAVGDGVHNDTSALRSAIATARPGDTVQLPANYVFRSGPLNLTSHITLEIQSNATLLASDNFSDYFLVEALPSYGIVRGSPFLRSRNVQNLTITGGGVIDGNGWAWAMWFAQQIKNGGYTGETSMRRPFLVVFEQASNVLLADVTVRNSPHWTVHIWNSDYVTIRNTTIMTDQRKNCSEGAWGRCYPNSDGIDVDSSRHTLIDNCTVESDDDAIAIKAGVGAHAIAFNTPTQNLTVINSDLKPHCCSAFRFGSESTGGVEDVTLRNSILHGSAEAAFVLSSCNDRNYTLRNVWVENVTVSGIDSFRAQPEDSSSLICRPSHDNFVRFDNFTFKDIIGVNTGTRRGSFVGLRLHDYTNFTFDNVDFGTSSTAYWHCDNIAQGDLVGRNLTPTLPASCGGRG